MPNPKFPALAFERCVKSVTGHQLPPTAKSATCQKQYTDITDSIQSWAHIDTLSTGLPRRYANCVASQALKLTG
jgi:hypothetical protein